MLEQRKLNEAAAVESQHDQNDIIRNKTVNKMNGRVQAQNGINLTMKHDNLRESHCRLNERIIRNGNSLNETITDTNHRSSIRKTNEWADSILKDLDSLILSNQRYTASLSNSIGRERIVDTGPPKSPQKRSTVINVVLRKTTPSTSPTSPTAPTAFPSTPTNLNKNQTTIITAATTKDNNKIPKPEKHVSGFDFSHLFFFYLSLQRLVFFLLNFLYLYVTILLLLSRHCFRHLIANLFDHLTSVTSCFIKLT